MKAWGQSVRITQNAAKKRANSIFGMISSQPTEEDEMDDDLEEEEHPNEKVQIAEKYLSNGDYYTGQWLQNIPHGTGKYWWSDGCMYVGEWSNGKTNGSGTFSWPSGAMYVGNFKDGFMDGEGTYTSPNGDTYKGSWSMDLKHGYGTKEYVNGDVYQGEWSRGLQDGRGKYTWKNENNYDGEWKSGVICGKGKMCLSNGSVYDGCWEDGLPKGNGTFRWPDGSSYVGFWSKNPDEQNGNYFPSDKMLQENAERDPQQVFNVDLKNCVLCPNETIYILPSKKKLAIEGVDSDSRQRSVDGRVDAELASNRLSDDACSSSSGSPATPGRRDHIGGGDSNVDSSGVKEEIKKGSLRLPKVVKRQGEPICKGHKNYELMLNLQLGIRHVIGRPGPTPSLDLKPSAFDPNEKFWTRFPPDGSKHTPPHTSTEFKWKDYCPKVFGSLRMLFKVDPTEYMLSICGDNALRELSSPGKSGSFFYMTNDDRYMIKTMKKAEMKALLRMLSAYYNHVRSFENTLLTKFFGLHSVKLGPAQKKVRFIIMGNLFCTSYIIHKRYDLKGSTFGRVTNKPESEIDANTTLKDLDLNFIFKLQNTWFKEFIRQVDRDCELLEQERIMDYSLLVGLHFIAANEDNLTLMGARDLKRDQLIVDPNGWADIKLGVSMPARVEVTERKEIDGEPQLIGEPIGECYDVVMFFNIIDILQDYDITKKLEHAYKSIQYDPNSISAVDPKQYSRRFREYIFNVFTEDI